jgi:hypothetical protein
MQNVLPLRGNEGEWRDDAMGWGSGEKRRGQIEQVGKEGFKVVVQTERRPQI